MCRKGCVILELQNYTEKVVNDVLDEVLEKREGLCKCEKCRLDIMAIALNNLPPQYYVSEKGEVFSKLLASYNDTRIKVVTEITKAAIQVQKEPHHDV
ncbi:late competence development ComFB family protein [Phosphitispora sp. TUW77]|uniref:late competence development ComFB family protein n=1 Tax=Phosphitispora sp. TUW77 TaxID=3152361 RepID=UPI003AB77C86